MHNDLVDLCDVADRNRKGWKTSGVAAEDRVSDVENATRKLKAKYDALAEDYDRARTGDSSASTASRHTHSHSGKLSLFAKSAKSLAQHEDDLLKKVQAADQAYQAQVQTFHAERASLLATTRPQTVHALRELVGEVDAMVGLVLQRFSE